MNKAGKIEVNIYLDEKARETISRELNLYLSNLQVFYAKLHNLHWNVEGRNFFKVHEKLEEYYDYVSDHIDEIAERILTLGYRPLVKLSDYAQNATLKEIDSKRYDVEESLNIVLKDFSELIGQLRNIIKLAQEYGDEGTADILIGSLKEFEKDSWMLRATLS
ncbi:MAG: DNA starvation/stationary phase protection protein [Defluviitoga tunisiensis]|jgi:starvation-inducible DNA-binding protein|nr:DNA starvation/stationary phase protection protein [Defluviitoga tunisiensis]HHV01487.1 DNA starvation/stationary phase protection protein [Defluviitoga tunisiensis]HOK15694.1 DNA starvation/stationary phase protection protein [Defluviitoga tunisiensis]HPU59889.1 DNA starvation/stationary phase protection protein [Defluviitoga tunisiensis]